MPLKTVESESHVERYGVGRGSALLTYDFVLVSKDAAIELKRTKATEAMSKLGQKFSFVDDLPVPELD